MLISWEQKIKKEQKVIHKYDTFWSLLKFQACRRRKKEKKKEIECIDRRIKLQASNQINTRVNMHLKENWKIKLK